ncbi:MAG: CPBP family intramembrane glutamic endopeptidase [Tepidisphaeraceae bacterium]
MTRASSVSARAASRSTPRPRRATTGYFRDSETPLTSLVFLLPLIVLYEVGTRQFVSDPSHATEQRIVAFSLMQRFFELCGATGRYLPAFVVITILMSCHLARRDPWRVKMGYLGAMWVESLALALPLILIGIVASRYLSHLPLAATTSVRTALLVLSLGAGVYEELVFRLMAFAVLSFILLDVFELPRGTGYLLIVLISSVMFSAYHYLGDEPFSVRTFAFRTVAGVYFGGVYLGRGFGITAAAHTLYDVLIVLWRWPM